MSLIGRVPVPDVLLPRSSGPEPGVPDQVLYITHNSADSSPIIGLTENNFTLQMWEPIGEHSIESGSLMK